ncbi:Carbon-phosphorus lyase complex subunit [uncultured Alphaproteobacteria bacterium]|uniref:Carbon-phosphorus lyase complex subunit n=1 Tax=uncultured Alphaproteobacteria bacterium TaxID=91750 RepID=A0A212J558_9PROT|nr:Carbon-phosphorus lyase complex subunit [uncultured Alphaproteobacteria bacterium]
MIPFPSRVHATTSGIPCPGFADPVRDAQRCFRRVLAAMSYPGRPQDLHGLLSAAPAPLYPTTAALCLTLFDIDTPVWLDGALDTPEVRQFLSFHCGCPMAAHPGEAAFALLAIGAAARLGAYHVGTPEYPDRAATLLIQTQAVSGGAPVSAAGPGIPGRQSFEIADTPAAFWAQRAAINAAFPTGLDVVFVDPRQIVGLPRGVRVETEDL